MTSAELAAGIGGTLEGDRGVAVTGVAEPESARAGDAVFCMAKAQREAVIACHAGLVVCGRELEIEPGKPVIRVDDPRLAMARALGLLYPRVETRTGISGDASVDPSARLGEDAVVFGGAWIGPGVEVGAGSIIHPGVVLMEGVRLGARCLIYPNVTICAGSVLGDRVIIHPGVVIGADGFGYAQDGHRIEKIPQVGVVRIGDDVEVGANTTIDRATLGETVVGAGTKIDNLVQIGHNVKIGRGCIIVAQTGIAGSVTVEDGVILGGQVGVADHVRIGAGAKVASQSGIARDVPAREVWSGSPAIPHRRWLRASKIFSDLPELNARLVRIENMLAREGAGRDEEAGDD